MIFKVTLLSAFLIMSINCCGVKTGIPFTSFMISPTCNNPEIYHGQKLIIYCKSPKFSDIRWHFDNLNTCLHFQNYRQYFC